MTSLEAAQIWYSDIARGVESLDTKASTLAGLIGVVIGLFIFRGSADFSCQHAWIKVVYLGGLASVVAALGFALWARAIHDYTTLPTPKRQVDYAKTHTSDEWEMMLIRSLARGGSIARKVVDHQARQLGRATWLLAAGLVLVVVAHVGCTL